jgi:hypothetical protein
MGSVEARKIQGLDASHRPRQFTLTLKVTMSIGSSIRLTLPDDYPHLSTDPAKQLDVPRA